MKEHEHEGLMDGLHRFSGNKAFVFALVCLALVISPVRGLRAQSGESNYLYVSSSSGLFSPGKVLAFKINATDGSLTAVPGSPFVAGNNPASVAVDPTNRFAFVTNTSSNNVSVYAIDPATGALAPVPGSPFAAGVGPRRAAVDPIGRFLYVANCGFEHCLGPANSTISVYSINSQTGVLTPAHDSPFSAGGGGFSIGVDPTGRFVYATDSGCLGCRPGGIYAYGVDATTGSLAPVPGSPFATNAVNPAPITIDSTGRFVYLGDNTGITLLAIDGTTGSLSPLSVISTFAGNCCPLEIVIDPTDRFLYAANSGANGLAAGSLPSFTIHPTGALTPIAGSPFNLPDTSHGTSSVAIDPTGRFVYATDQNTLGFSSVEVYSADVATGALTLLTGARISTEFNSTSLATTHGPVSAAVSILAISPSKGGDSGSVTTTILGTGFRSGATARLTRAGQTDIVATKTTVQPGGRVIVASFDLRAQAQGQWDVVVTNLDGGSTTLPGAFAVEEGGRPGQIWVDLIGRTAIRRGLQSESYIMVGNRGNVDAVAVPLFISVSGPCGVRNPGSPSTCAPFTGTVKLDFSIVAPVEGGGVQRVDQSQLPIMMQTAFGLQTVFPVVIPAIPPGFTASLGINVMSALDFEIDVWIGPSFFGSPVLTQAGAQCILSCLNAIYGLTSAVPFGGCAAAALTIPLAGVTGIVDLVLSLEGELPAMQVVALEGFISSVMLEVAKKGVECAGQTLATPLIILSVIADAAQAADAVSKALDDCDFRSLARAFRRRLVLVRGSLDPNDKTGSEGAGDLHYLSGAEPLRYGIFFQNLETATAPARNVTVTDQLDLTKNDPNTFVFGPIAVAGTIVTPTVGNHFATDVDLRPAQNLVVRINADFDANAGLLIWQLASIDPATGLPPTDALVGFLPPGVEGSVTFTVMPGRGLPTGTLVQNQAKVVFDQNAPVITAVWSNTLDNTPPTSQMAALPAQSQPIFTIRWSGTDIGSGVRDYTVFVSQDGGPFAAFLTNTTATSASFSGQPGHSYSFFSSARDQAGNIEQKLAVGETSTRIAADTTPPTTTANQTPGPNANGWNNTNVIVTLTATDNPDGSGVKQLSYTLSGAQTGSVVVPGNSASTTVSTEGLTTLTYFATDNAGNQEAPKTLSVKIDKTPPTMTCSVSPNTLWPPNHKPAAVTASVSVSDALSGPSGFALTSVTSNEPPAAGDIQGFAVGTTATTGQLIATRLGSGSGRVYTMTYQGKDVAGNTATCSAIVTVPHDQGK